MDKLILAQYVDAKEVARETDLDIQDVRRERERIARILKEAAVKSMGNKGSRHTERKLRELDKQEELLNSRLTGAATIVQQVDEWMNAIPQRMQRIVKYKIFENMTWGQVAMRMGRGATPDGIRKEYENFMKVT